jgi:hypothetical protein
MKSLENLDKVMKTQQETMIKLEELLKKTKKVAFVNEKDETFEESIMDVENVLFLKDNSAVDVMLMDTGCPQSLVGKGWVERYLEKNKILLEDLEVKKCSQKFRFSPSKVYKSTMLVRLPITVR